MSKTTLATGLMLFFLRLPMKKVVRVLAALVALWPIACARREAPAPAATIYRHLEGEPPTLDPTVTNEEIGMRVEQMLFSPLVGIDRDLRPVPALAVSWTVSADGLTFDFRLDPKARWEDGTPVTSEDVAFTIDRVRDPKVPAVNWKWGFEDVAAVETPEPSHAVVRFRRPYAQRLLAFSMPIVSRAAFGRGVDAGRHPFASGPYRLESWEAKQTLTLVRRADQSAQTYPFQKIVFRVIPDSAVTFRAGTLGQLDEFRVARDQRGEAERSADFQQHNRLALVPRPTVVLLVWNCRNPLLSDARVRLALMRAWPRAEVARRLFPPEGATLLSGPYPAGVRENAPDVAPPPYDPAASAKLLEEAGLRMGKDGFRQQRGRRASLEFLLPAGQPMYVNIGEILRDAYRKVGVELVLRPMDWAAYTQRFTAGEFEVLLNNYELLPPNLDPYPYYHSSQVPPAGQNNGFYRNAQADRLMEAAQSELDDGRRIELYRQIHRLLAADPPADFLWTVGQYWGISRRLAGVEVSPLGLFHFLPGPLGWRLAPARR
jgi:peptide/nickel transport system substrate-binding protein